VQASADGREKIPSFDSRSRGDLTRTGMESPVLRYEVLRTKRGAPRSETFVRLAPTFHVGGGLSAWMTRVETESARGTRLCEIRRRVSGWFSCFDSRSRGEGNRTGQIPRAILQSPLDWARKDRITVHEYSASTMWDTNLRRIGAP